MYNLRNFAVEMKSKSHILILLLVSMMITYVGAGQLVAQCRHTGMVEAVDAHDSCNGCCHKQQKKCMTLSVKKNLIRRRAATRLCGESYAFRFAVGTAYRFLCGDPPCRAAERVCHWRV